MANKPIFSRRLNKVEVAIWRNESDEAVWHNVTLQRTYRDEKNEVQNTTNFRMEDLPALAFLAIRAYQQLELTEDE